MTRTQAAVAALALPLLLGAPHARAGFVLVSNPADLGANDAAGWPSNYLLGDPLTSTVYGGAVRWGEKDQSFPDYNTVVSVNTPTPHALFIGTAANPDPGLAFYDLNFYFDFHGMGVFGVGAQVAAFSVLPTQLTAYDVFGNSQTFNLPASFPQSFVGVLSDRPIARLEFFGSTGGQVGGAGITVGTLDFSVAPAPPGLALGGIAALCLAGWGWPRRRRGKSAVPGA